MSNSSSSTGTIPVSRPPHTAHNTGPISQAYHKVLKPPVPHTGPKSPVPHTGPNSPPAHTTRSMAPAYTTRPMAAAHGNHMPSHDAHKPLR